MTDSAHHRRRHRTWLIWLGIALIVLIAATAWLGFRALSARDSLESAASSAAAIPGLVRSGDTSAAVTAAESFAEDARSAEAATSDPIWRIAENIPWVGTNFAAVGGMSAVAANLATVAIVPLATAAADIDPSALGFSGGRIDVASLEEVAPMLSKANGALERAVARVDVLPDPTLPIVSEALAEFRTNMKEAAAVVDGLDRAAEVLPAMVGTDGPRTYLLLVLNNAEARTFGGIAGAGAVLRFQDGRVEIERQLASGDFDVAPDPVVGLSRTTLALFEDLPGRFIQNTVSSLDFPEAASAAAGLWEHSSGQRVDGVIAIDAVSIGYILEATGAIQAGPFALDSDNAVETLLSASYAQIPDTALQDEAFALAARGIMDTLSAGQADPDVLLSALGRAMSEQRLHVWSSHPEEEARITGTPLATILPSDRDESRFGIFVNDVTGAKLDYYATPSTTLTLRACAEAPRVEVTVDWTNTIPADAAVSLPDYVLGPELTVAQRGETLTRIAVAGPDGWLATDYSIDGERQGVQAAQYGGRTLIQHEFVTSPGGAHRIVVEFTAPEGTSLEDMPLEAVSTPLVHANVVKFASAPCGE